MTQSHSRVEEKVEGRRVGEVGEGWVTAVTAFPNSDLVASGMCNGLHYSPFAFK